MAVTERRPQPLRGPASARPHSNLAILRVTVLVAFAILTARLAQLQIIHGDEYAERARSNHLRVDQVLPPRGLILDRNGTPLVENVPIYRATVVPALLPNDRQARYRIYLRLESITGVPAVNIQQLVEEAESAGRKESEVEIASHLSQEQAIVLDQAAPSLPGVSLAITPSRQYLGGPAFGPLLGYIGPQFAEDQPRYRAQGYLPNQPVGKDGIELAYESALRGSPGLLVAEQNALGEIQRVLETRPSVPGGNVQLAIDANLQQYVYDLLVRSLGEATTAAAVVMNPKTGEIYALVSVPGYDNNIFQNLEQRGHEYEALLNDPRKPLLNHALVPAAPGSTFKLVTAAAALQEGRITPSTGRTIDSPILEVRGENGVIYPLKDWRTHGYLDLRGAIAWSSNIYFYMASCGIPQEGIQGLGKDPLESANILAYYARAFGFGEPSGIDIGGEMTGVVPTPDWKRRSRSGPMFNPEDREWYLADTCFMGIGQGDVTATPLQVARMTAAIANGGTLVTPHVVNAVLDAQGNVIQRIEPSGKPVPVAAEHLQVIREGMLLSVRQGAGAAAAQRGIEIAGKTGTAEFTTPDGQTKEHAWFTGFAPYDDPQVVVTVYFDLGMGGAKAAPIAGQIIRYFLEHHQP